MTNLTKDNSEKGESGKGQFWKGTSFFSFVSEQAKSEKRQAWKGDT